MFGLIVMLSMTLSGHPSDINKISGPKMKFIVCYTRQITDLFFFAILIFFDKSIFLSKYIVLYALSRPIDYLTFKFTC